MGHLLVELRQPEIVAVALGLELRPSILEGQEGHVVACTVATSG